MGGDAGPSGVPGCSTDGCERDATFWLYRPPTDRWDPYCDRHLREVHPSVEIRAWLESGYAKPAELGRPDGRPATPAGGRAAGFRALVDDALGWGSGESDTAR